MLLTVGREGERKGEKGRTGKNKGGRQGEREGERTERGTAGILVSSFTVINSSVVSTPSTL